MKKHNVDRKGEKNSQAKLTADDVRAIRKAHKDLVDSLCERHSITRAYLGKIVAKSRWPHLSAEDGP